MLRSQTGPFLTGSFLAFTGAILPAWGYGIRPQFAVTALNFLALHGGVLLSFALAGMVARVDNPRAVLVSASLLACLAFLWLAFAGPSMPAWSRLPAFAAIGLATALFTGGPWTAVAAPPVTETSAASSKPEILAGSLFLAFLSTSALGFRSPAILSLEAAAIAGTGAYIFLRGQWPGRPPTTTVPGKTPGISHVLTFLQSGLEWSLAGWLPLYFIGRLGISPASSAGLLVTYFSSLLVVRALAPAILPSVRLSRVLVAATTVFLFGCFILVMAVNIFGAALALLLIGTGLGPIPYVLAQRLQARFEGCPQSAKTALAGATLMPALAGFATHLAGRGAIPAVPAAISIVVLALVFALWVQTKLYGRQTA